MTDFTRKKEKRTWSDFDIKHNLIHKIVFLIDTIEEKIECIDVGHMTIFVFSVLYSYRKKRTYESDGDITHKQSPIDDW